MMKMPLLSTIAALIWATFAGAEPMTFQSVSNGGNCYIGCSWTVADGEITPETPEAFKAYLDVGGANPILFNSTGGDLEAAMALARIIRDADMDTMIGISRVYSDLWHEPVEGGTCSDACAIAFLGGVKRLIGLRTFNYEYAGQLSFERLGNREILGSLTDETLSGRDLLNEQIAIGIFVNFLIEMGVSSELFAELSKLQIGASLAIDLDLARALDIATFDQTQRQWSLSQLNSGLALKTGGPDEHDGLWAFCSRDTFYLARAYSKVNSEGSPCDGDFCYSAENIANVFNGSKAVVSGGEFPIQFLDVLPLKGNIKALVRTQVTKELMLALPAASKVSLKPAFDSRVALSFARVFEWDWGQSFDERLMALALKNCAN